MDVIAQSYSFFARLFLDIVLPCSTGMPWVLHQSWCQAPKGCRSGAAGSFLFGAPRMPTWTFQGTQPRQEDDGAKHCTPTLHCCMQTLNHVYMFDDLFLKMLSKPTLGSCQYQCWHFGLQHWTSSATNYRTKKTLTVTTSALAAEWVMYTPLHSLGLGDSMVSMVSLQGDLAEGKPVPDQ